MTYGCGAEKTCKECYPYTYRCDCGVDYMTPVPFGEKLPVCTSCWLDGDTLEYVDDPSDIICILCGFRASDPDNGCVHCGFIISEK
jgi:hypothetical protein